MTTRPIFKFPTMKRISLTMAAALALLTRGVAAPAEIFENFGQIFDPPQVDARAFANYGTIDIFTSLPYDFQNTLNFTNYGVMIGTVGFQFDTAASLGDRQRARSFYNAPGATVAALDGGITTFFLIPEDGSAPIQIGTRPIPAYLLVNAETIQNYGLLSVGNIGLLKLQGLNVDLAHSGLEVQPIIGDPFSTPTNFVPDVGIYDLYWGATNDVVTANPNIAGGNTGITAVSAPPHQVFRGSLTQPQFGFTGLSAFNPQVSVYSEVLTETNLLIQIVAVGLTDPNITAAVRFADSPIATNAFKTALVELSMLDTNIITGDEEFIRLYIKDELASFTNNIISTNLSTLAPLDTARPSAYEVQRFPFLQWTQGFDPTGVIFPDPFPTSADGTLTPAIFNALSTNNVITNSYAAYQMQIDSQGVRPPQVPLLEATDLPGRVEVTANTLNLEGARIRGSGLVTITGTNLLSTTGAIIDSENVSLNFTRPTQRLQISDLVRERAQRLNGIVSAWSGVWTNVVRDIGYTNIIPSTDPDNPDAGETNIFPIEVAFHMMVVNAGPLASSLLVSTHDLRLTGPEIVFNDTARVVRSLILDTEHFTLGGGLTVAGRLQNFFSTNAPKLKFFTNTGRLTVPSVTDFGRNRATRYETVVNRGVINSGGLLVRSALFQNSGAITTSADGLTVEADLAVLQDGLAEIATDVRITAKDLKIANYTNINLIGGVDLNVTGGLTDTGDPESNFWETRRGFRLGAQPTAGDLLGTVIHTYGPRFRQVDHTWAGEDRGQSAAGFENNLALGKLVLDGDRGTRLRFRGLRAGQALYVTFLELEGSILTAFEAGQLNQVLSIDPSLVIYFADSSVPPEDLNGLLADADAPDGRLRWVPEFGAVHGGNGSGAIQNFNFIASPASAASPSGTVKLSLSWQAAAGRTYVIETTTDLAGGKWDLLQTVQNSGGSARTLSAEQTVTRGETQRYFRIRQR